MMEEKRRVKLMRTTLGPDEVMCGFNESIQFMIKSIMLYDQGDVSEGKRIAVELRKLLHDTSNSKSILEQLGLKTEMFYSSISTPLDDSHLNWSGLTNLRITLNKGERKPAEAKEVAIRGDLLQVGTTKSFQDWWEETIIRDWNKNTFTRNSIIIRVANQDNGAHMDSQIESSYYDLTRNNSMGLSVGVYDRDTQESKWQGSEIIHLASIRQIAHELLYSVSQMERVKDNTWIKAYVSTCK